MTTTRAGIRLLALLAAAAGALFASAPSKAATNLAPNPGFELSCFGAPCNWGGVLSNVNPHSGAASNQLTETQTGAFSFAVASNCVPVASATSYSFSAWYRTAAASITFVSFSAAYYPSVTCTGTGTNPGGASGSVTTNGWQHIAGTASSPAGTQSAILLLVFGCATGCANLATGNFDDLDMEAQPTAVTFGSATASRTANGVVLRWRTASETNTLGFNVYRQTDETRVRVNARLIPAAATAVPGRRYSFLDRTAPPRTAIRYWIQAVNADGSSGWRGPVVVQRGGNGREQ